MKLQRSQIAPENKSPAPGRILKQGFERFSILGHRRPTRRVSVGLSEAAMVSKRILTILANSSTREIPSCPYIGCSGDFGEFRTKSRRHGLEYVITNKLKGQLVTKLQSRRPIGSHFCQSRMRFAERVEIGSYHSRGP